LETIDTIDRSHIWQITNAKHY